MRTLTIIATLFAWMGHPSAQAQIRVHPTGVNVNVQGPTTVFLTFGGISGYQPAESFWCGELLPPVAGIGAECNPTTLYGALPTRYDLSRPSGSLGLTDIMSIPTSVARRAYQAAAGGEASTFFYVRRFQSLTGGPDQFIAVTCRLTGGGARVPFALTNVEVAFDLDVPVLFVESGATPPPVTAEIAYNGTGTLQGRWEVVLPGETPPQDFDLVPEASLPVELRGTQTRFTEIERFNVFLPPTGTLTLEGPDPTRIPTDLDGAYQLLLRIEATDDKEGDSDLGAAGAGAGIVHSGAVAGFALPALRYYVGSDGSSLSRSSRVGTVRLTAPFDAARLSTGAQLRFSWEPDYRALAYRIEIEAGSDQRIVEALLPSETTTYRAPSWLPSRAEEGSVRWRVTALDGNGEVAARSEWRSLTWRTGP